MYLLAWWTRNFGLFWPTLTNFGYFVANVSIFWYPFYRPRWCGGVPNLMLSVLWPMAFQKWLVYCLYCFWDIFRIWIWTPFAIYSKLQSATRYFAWNCNIVYDWIEIVTLLSKLGQIDTMVEYQCSLGGQKKQAFVWAVDHGDQNKRNPKHQNLKHCARGTTDPWHWVSNHYWVLEANQRASKYLPNFRLVFFGKVQ